MWSIIISLIALIVSGLTFYYTHVSPFDPKLTPADPMWKAETADSGERLVFIVPISFFNDGARLGFIKELRLELHSYDVNVSWKFYPFVFLNYESYSKAQKDLPQRMSIFAHIESPFSSILLAGKQSLFKTVVFFPREDLSSKGVKAGKYRVRLSFWESLTGPPIPFYEANYQLGEAMIKSLQTGKAIIPLNDLVDGARKQ